MWPGTFLFVMPGQQLAFPDGAAQVPLIAIEATDPGWAQWLGSPRLPAGVVVAVSRDGHVPPQLREFADICLTGHPDAGLCAVTVPDLDEAVARLEAAVAARPVASQTLAWLLRASSGVPVPEALALESAAYSMLLAGGEFQDWLSQRGVPRPAGDARRVRVERSGAVLSIVLARPARRNAVDAAMRDALVSALLIAEADDSLDVVISGEGPSFCAGGDLDEFGTATDVSVAHLVRLTASVGAAIHRIRDRVTVRVHGACMGAGMELPAFAGRVIARPGTEFALPEISMGLIPGAGGTVGIPRRIGRHRTMWLALTASRLAVKEAVAWGLVDAVE
jgi:hypothetical protein